MKKISQLAPEIIRDIKPEVFNSVYLPYVNTINHYEIYFGSAGSGKSYFVAQKVALQMSAIAGRNMLALRKSANDSRDSVYPEILGALRQFHLLDVWNIVEHPKIRMTNIINGNEIIFDGLDSVENIKSIKFKSGNLTDIWLEEATEETEPGNIRQLDMRMRDVHQKGRIILSFNPVSRQHFLKNMIEKEFMASGDCIVVRSTYKDNRFLPKQYAQQMEALRFTDPYRYMVYALGEWGVTGASVFNQNKVHERLQKLHELHALRPPIKAEFEWERDEKTGFVQKDSFKIFHATTGETTIYKEAEPRVPYVVSCDPSGEGIDYTVAQVINNITGEQVAVYRSRETADVCAYQIYGLACYYNNALYAPEVNMGETFLSRFKDFGYRNIYQRGTPIDDYNEGIEQKYGFRTTVGNRKKMLEDLIEWANINMDKINDPETLNEFLTFTLQEKKLKGMFMGAEAGAHDDLVMALAIALQARQQQSCEMSAELEGSLKGTWLPMQLKSAVEAGRITHEQKKEYEKNHAGHARLGTGINRNAIKRRSRYDR